MARNETLSSLLEEMGCPSLILLRSRLKHNGSLVDLTHPSSVKDLGNQGNDSPYLNQKRID